MCSVFDSVYVHIDLLCIICDVALIECVIVHLFDFHSYNSSQKNYQIMCILSHQFSVNNSAKYGMKIGSVFSSWSASMLAPILYY